MGNSLEYLRQIAELPTDVEVGKNFTKQGRLARSSGSLGVVQRLEYNGYVFPPAVVSSASIVPLYSETGRHRTGTRISIEVSTVLIDQTNNATKSSFAADRNDPDFVIPSTDLNLSLLRRALNQNGKLLRFELQGLGIVAVSGNADDAVYGETSTQVVMDIEKGPKTEMIEWTPITPLATRINWKVTVTVSDCYNSEALPFYTDFHGTIQTSVDHQGQMTRTISGALAVPTPISSDFAKTALEAEYEESILAKQFPRLLHFSRTYETSLSADGGVLTFTITDTEMKSDSPWFPGTSEPDVTLETGSGLESGAFGIWKTRLSGTIPVMNGVSKVYGFLAAIALIDYFLDKSSQGQQPNDDEDSGSGTSTSMGESFAILTNLSFSDPIYQREVSFTAEWDLMTDVSSLLQATGMFQPVVPNYEAITYNNEDSEGDYDANDPISFERWKASATRQVTPYGIHEFIYASDDFPQVRLCSEKYVEPKLKPNEFTPTPVTVPTKAVRAPAPEKSYTYADMEVVTRKTTETYVAAPLVDQPVTRSLEDAGSGLSKRIVGDTNANPSSYPPLPPDETGSSTPTTPRQALRKTGRSRHLVEVSGLMIRVGYKPIVPYVGSIGGQPAYEVGTSSAAHQVIGRGATTATSGKYYDIHAVAFSQTYAVDDPIDDFNVTDSGGKAVFNRLVQH